LQHGGTVAALGLTIGNGIYTMDGTGVLSAERVDVRADGRLNLYGGQITLGTLPSNPGTLTVELGGFVHVDGTLPNSTPIKFYGGVNNFGTISLNSANITWNDVFLNGNAYINDPSTSIFNNDLVVTTNGYIKAGVGDIFEIRRNFLNSSTNAAMWDTDLATLFFGGAGRHEFGIDGIDRGANGFGDNFGWDDIILDAGAQLVFYDSNPASAKPALYVRVFSFSGNLDANSFLLPGGTSLTIYYDQTAPENQPLINALAGLQLPAGLTFTGYGSTQGAPEPGTLALLGLGLAGLVASRRRKH
jgi:hypothetical protein